MSVEGSPIRRGVCVYLTLDFDALPLLDELAPGPRSRGRFLSELIRAEYGRREDRALSSQRLAQDRVDRLVKAAQKAVRRARATGA